MVSQGLEVEGIIRSQGIFRAVKVLYDTIMVCNMIHLLKPTECTTARVKPNVNYGLLEITRCQCRFISCNKCTTLWKILMRRESGRVGKDREFMRTLLMLSAQLCYEPKMPFIRKVYLKKQQSLMVLQLFYQIFEDNTNL